MRSRQRRHLASVLQPSLPAAPGLLKAAHGEAAGATRVLPPEFSWRDYAIFLLHTAAEIEHALMVQYLYAAYSLGGPQVPEAHREAVRGWQEVVLGIAKEEMGHLISVLNVLRLLGGPVNLDREDYPWDSEFYPFTFRLEPLTRESLAKYVYVEAPEQWEGSEAEEVTRIALEAAKADHRGDGGDEGPIHRVGKLYKLLTDVIRDQLSDEDFQADTYPYQASFAEWGRNYTGGARGNTVGKGPEGTPDVIVQPLSSRDDAVAALEAIAQQGEALDVDEDDGQKSHFRRFLTIFREFPELSKDGWRPTRLVPTNPRTPRNLDGEERVASAGEPVPACIDITHPEAVLWAHLFNVRYRMALTYLSHAYRLSGALVRVGQLTARGYVVNSTFGEMYTLRALANILVQLPLSAAGGSEVAGPPFEMPYSLELPDHEQDRWRLHRDLLVASRILQEQLHAMKGVADGRRAYLEALRDADAGAMRMVEAMLHEPVGAHGKGMIR
jgi:hypothetical protein